MKLIIAGSRTLKLGGVILHGSLGNFNLDPKEIIEGGAKGVDKYAADYATVNQIPLKTFHADWDKHGKAAGPIRNREMAEYADALLLIWDGESKGSFNMKRTMLELNKPVYEVILKTYEKN